MSIDALRQAVQYNCDLSDREFATDYSICIYLIRMREYYRWAHHLAPNDALDQSSLLEWISETEARWEAIEADDFQPIAYAGKTYQPFEKDRLNQVLAPHGYTYQAGYGRFGKPVFMLAELESIEQNENYQLVIAGQELARELTAPPASLQANDILIRKQAVSRLIWDMLEEWQWQRPDNAMAEVVKFYDFDKRPMHALEQASRDQQEVLILHEIGELVAQDMVSPDWNDMLAETNKHQDIFARAVRDCLADCVSTLPGLLADENIPAVHFYFASLTPLRKTMFPTLIKAYRSWRGNGSVNALKQAIKYGQQHWLKVADRLVDEFAHDQRDPDQSVQMYIDQHSL